MDTKRKILIVEDEHELCEALEYVLKKLPVTVLTAHEGAEALNLTVENHPDLIICDLGMAGTDGLSYLEQLRADDWGAHAHAIVLSNYSDIEHVSKAMDSGITQYYIKSDIHLKEIVEKVEEHLSELDKRE